MEGRGEKPEYFHHTSEFIHVKMEQVHVTMKFFHHTSEFIHVKMEQVHVTMKFFHVNMELFHVNMRCFATTHTGFSAT